MHDAEESSQGVYVNQMTIDQLLGILYEEETEPLDHKARVFVDRLLLRIMTSPALMSFLDDVQINKSGEDFQIELKFRAVPDEQINVIQRLIGQESDGFSFEDDGVPYYGFRTRITPDQLQPVEEE